MGAFTEIPVLDAAALWSGDAAAYDRLAADFLDAYANAGFAYVVNHGVDPALTDGVFDAARRFHALPDPAKRAIELDANHRGFIPIDTSTDVNSKLAEVRRPNQSESFMMMREDGPDAPEVRAGAYLAGPNQWPDLPGFRAAAMAYHDALAALGRQLVDLAARSVGADPARLAPAFERPTTWLRLLHYPPTRAEDGDDLYGSAPHTDFGFLTILAQDDVGGLQVMTPEGDWVDAPRKDGAFVVNVGDMLHRWTNGRLRSTPHRVINRSGRERFSCPFFYDPNVAATITPAPETVTAARPAAFPAVNFGEFLRAELEAGYEAHKGAQGV